VPLDDIDSIAGDSPVAPTHDAVPASAFNHRGRRGAASCCTHQPSRSSNEIAEKRPETDRKGGATPRLR
jgi:hypothetical protein